MRFSKPKIPDDVAKSYNRIVTLQTEILKATVQHKMDLQTIETEKAQKIARIQSKSAEETEQVKADESRKLGCTQAQTHTLTHTAFYPLSSFVSFKQRLS